MRQGLSSYKAAKDARFFGMISAGTFLVLVLVPIMIVRLYASLFLLITAWLFMFHGATVVSLHLNGLQRWSFQVVISLAFPTVLSLYFLDGVSIPSVRDAAGSLPGFWLLIPIAFIGYMSWVAADQLNRDHPFRGFLIASTLLFFICYFGHHGIYYEGDTASTPGFVIDYKKVSGISPRSGYFTLFLIYVSVSYGAMILRYMIQRSKPC